MISNIKRPLIICIIIFFIPVSNSIFHTYSYGIFLLAVVINFLYKILLSKNEFKFLLFLIAIIYIQTMLTSGLNFKAALSCVILVYCSFIYFRFGEKAFYEKFGTEKKIYFSFLILLFVISFISFTLSFYGNHGIVYQNRKSAFPFEEPSHLALFISPILIALSSNFRPNHRFIISFFLIIFSLYFQSLIFFGFAVISILLCLDFRFNYKKIIFLSFIILIVYLLDSMFINGYLFERISHIFNINTINMSALVYFQGWNSIFDSLRNHFFGIGFQFLGNEPVNYFSQRIYYLSGGYVNRQDGGFLLAKFLSEFGYLGFIVIFLLYRYIINIIKQYKPVYPREIMFIHFLLVSLLVPLLFRDIGYFSYTLIFIFFGIGYLFAISKKFILR